MIPLPDKKYNIIYADPPWQFKYQSKKRTDGTSEDANIRDPQKEYSCMNINDIYNLPIQDIADKNCILFIWVTYPLLKEGLKTIEQWEFEYKTCAFSWVKKNKKADSFFWGLGYWTRANNEICLLATKGKPSRVSKSVHQIVYEPITKHSQKPIIVRDKIIKLCGDLPRIELFARHKVDGWDSWGNEVEDNT
jgi:N6-adenosine-specific RNA methylase IME4|tara:strand:+ start:81 stop:656 length:576 start_codon:yes stop_codon:yes gene_type:complete